MELGRIGILPQAARAREKGRRTHTRHKTRKGQEKSVSQRFMTDDWSTSDGFLD